MNRNSKFPVSLRGESCDTPLRQQKNFVTEQTSTAQRESCGCQRSFGEARPWHFYIVPAQIKWYHIVEMVSSRTFYNVLSQRTSIFQSWHPLIPHCTFAARIHRNTPVVESQPCHASVVPNIIQRFQTVKTLFLSPHIIFPVWRAQTFHHWKAFTHIWRQGGLGSAKLPRDSDLSNKWLRQGEAAISRLWDKLSIRNRWVLRLTSRLWF